MKSQRFSSIRDSDQPYKCIANLLRIFVHRAFVSLILHVALQKALEEPKLYLKI
jgi:hypothetical protein